MGLQKRLTPRPAFPLRAHQSTTAAGIAEVLRIVLEMKLTGPLLQSQVPTSAFLAGPFVQIAYVDEQARG